MLIREFTLGSLFDGIAGFPEAGRRNGIKAIWASEIEPFPLKVSAIRFPDMEQKGDITKLNGAELEPVDIITGGSPCQDLSVAGKRAGLAGARSGLFMEQIRIVREARENGRTGTEIRPRFMVWENVPGAFSSNKGEDFRAVLEETAKIADETVIIPGPPKGKWSTVGCIMGDGWSIAWRILDAQHWGVPQRRRRIFLVADFGGQSAPEVLFKREGLSRHIVESRKKREGIAANVEGSVNTPITVDFGRTSDRIECNTSVSVTLKGTGGGGGAKTGLYCVPNKVYGICSDASNSMKSNNPNSGIYEAETSRTLDQNGGNPACNQGGMAIVQAAGFIGRNSENARSIGYEEEKSPTLRKGMTPDVMCAGFNGYKSVSASIQYLEETAATLEANMPGNIVASFYPQMKAESQCYREDDISNTLVNGTNPGYQNGIVTYQKVTGPLMANSHPGSYTGQDVHSDMLITPFAQSSFTDYKEGFGQLRASGGDLGGGSETLIKQHYSVRRLTPLECERLQDYPGGWTDIPGASDSGRYKACGNSVAVCCPEYVLEGIADILNQRSNTDGL